MVAEKLSELNLNTLYHMDCLEGMKSLPDQSIDMVLCDLPHDWGTPSDCFKALK